MNFVGVREINIYGRESYKSLCDKLKDYCAKNNISVEVMQSNLEGDIVNFIQESYEKKVNCIIINPGAFGHYSYSIRDALISVSLPTIEVHMSNIYARDEFRKKSVLVDICIGQICGLGLESYKLAIDFFRRTIKI
jgi:3-dehydroquinate dehydratase-2